MPEASLRPNGNGNGNGNGTKWHTFFQFNVGHALIIIGMVASGAWWFVSYDRELTITKITLNQKVELFKSLSERVDAMDNNGTHYSQRNIDKEFDLYKVSADRLTRQEQLTSDLIPKVEHLGYEISNISEWVNQQKKLPQNK